MSPDSGVGCGAVLDQCNSALSGRIRPRILLLYGIHKRAGRRLQCCQTVRCPRTGKPHTSGRIHQKNHIRWNLLRPRTSCHPGFQFNLIRSVSVIPKSFPHMNTAVFCRLCYTVFIGSGDRSFSGLISAEILRMFFRSHRKNQIPCQQPKNSQKRNPLPGICAYRPVPPENSLHRSDFSHD